MSNCAIVGINWGDEGKGRMVDLLTERFDVVVRYQGGGNAGHTVINEHGKFALHLLPSGIFRPGVVNILGNGVALDLENLWKEIGDVAEKGVAVTPEILRISDRASLLLPWHRQLDGLEEARLGGKKFGSTLQGIAPFYSDKFQKKTILAGELLYPERLREHARELTEWKNLTLTGVYGAQPVRFEDLLAWLEEFGGHLKPYICDTGALLRSAAGEGKRILFEAQLGALRDLDYGIHPYTTSSNPIAAYAPIGSGYPEAKLDEIVGVVKAYSSCVGEGPFTCEWFGEEAEKLRVAGNEYGAKTGRPRRVGPIDLVATRYGVRCQGATALALTKLDVLSYMENIPVCARYEIDGQETDEFPFPALLPQAKPVVEYLPGWKCDISGARRWEELPKEARDYVEYLEKALGVPFAYVSVGAARDEIILREEKAATPPRRGGVAGLIRRLTAMKDRY
ncbi:MAG: adenylosuccinate synthase, partial [Oscillospiraceae bacterium]|nr:adenylosuccinate synthase [Oscillospiraceae bacterium]